MDEQELNERIAALRVPGEASAEQRMVDAASARLGRPRPRLRRRLLGGLAGILVAAGLALTPPVQAVAERIGELVGIGEPATVEQRASKTFGPVLVAGAGETPDGLPVEIVVFSGGGFSEASEAAPPFQGSPKLCFGVDYPTKPKSPGGNELCGEPPGAMPMPGAFDYRSRFGPKTRYSLEGTIGPGVADVEVTYEEESGERVTAPVLMAGLDEQLQQAAGVDVAYGFYVAYLPDDGTEGDGFAEPSQMISTVVLEAYGEDGELLKSIDWGAETAAAARRRQQAEDADADYEMRIAAAFELAADRLEEGAPAPGVDREKAITAMRVLAKSRESLRGSPYQGTRLNSLIARLQELGILEEVAPPDL